VSVDIHTLTLKSPSSRVDKGGVLTATLSRVLKDTVDPRDSFPRIVCTHELVLTSLPQLDAFGLYTCVDRLVLGKLSKLIADVDKRKHTQNDTSQDTMCVQHLYTIPVILQFEVKSNIYQIILKLLMSVDIPISYMFRSTRARVD
jgi:hypothetical protein